MGSPSASTLFLTIFVAFVAVQNIEGGIMHILDVVYRLHNGEIKTTTVPNLDETAGTLDWLFIGQLSTALPIMVGFSATSRILPASFHQPPSFPQNVRIVPVLILAQWSLSLLSVHLRGNEEERGWRTVNQGRVRQKFKKQKLILYTAEVPLRHVKQAARNKFRFKKLFAKKRMISEDFDCGAYSADICSSLSFDDPSPEVQEFIRIKRHCCCGYGYGCNCTCTCEPMNVTCCCCGCCGCGYGYG